MVKDNGYWVPVVFGWLPDKSETSYKVFFYMIEKKLEEMGLELKVRSVLCDFELNIMKSIDMMLQVPIMGCFFHHKKCFQRRVEKKGFKTRFENDEKFNKFIAEISSISFLPISDVQDGLKHVDSKFTFDDEKAKKMTLLNMAKSFGLMGQFLSEFGMFLDDLRTQPITHKRGITASSIKN